MTDLRAADTYNLSTATLLREGRGLLFYHTKVALLNHVLNHTAHRGADDSPPEVSLDPLEALEGVFIRVTFSDQQILALLNRLNLRKLTSLLNSSASEGFQARPRSLHTDRVSVSVYCFATFRLFITCTVPAFPKIGCLTCTVKLLARGFFRWIIFERQSR